MWVPRTVHFCLLSFFLVKQANDSHLGVEAVPHFLYASHTRNQRYLMVGRVDDTRVGDSTPSLGIYERCLLEYVLIILAPASFIGV